MNANSLLLASIRHYLAREIGPDEHWSVAVQFVVNLRPIHGSVIEYCELDSVQSVLIVAWS